MLQRAASTAVQREELSALTLETHNLDRLLRNCLKDENVFQSDATAKVIPPFFFFVLPLMLVQALHRAKAASLSQFLSGRRKNIANREKGVFSNDELREYYYKKKF
jgi:hypothetical protein